MTKISSILVGWLRQRIIWYVILNLKFYSCGCIFWTHRKKERKKGENLSVSQIDFLQCILLDTDIPVKGISKAYSVSSVLNRIKKKF